MTVICRFAPSPTGRLHVGNVRTALMNWLFVREKRGKFILRIDDTDIVRSTDAYELGIKEDLNWLGMGWDYTFNQSKRFSRYKALAENLKKMDYYIHVMKLLRSLTGSENFNVFKANLLYITARDSSSQMRKS